MVALSDLTPGQMEPNCAICGTRATPECPHEGQRLQLALDQAMERWVGYRLIREWVLNHARNQIIATFQELRQLRVEAHNARLHTLPYYTLYRRFNGRPPLGPEQLRAVQGHVHHANVVLQQGIDQDWRSSCLRYPEVLDYYFQLVESALPSERDPRITSPTFGAPSSRRALKERRNSLDMKEHRKRDRRRSRGRTPPPHAPMVGSSWR